MSLTTADIDDVEQSIRNDDSVEEKGRVDDVRGIIVFVRASSQSDVEAAVGDEDAVYTVESDEDNVYRVGLPMEGP